MREKELPEELTVDILSRLPAQSLLRFRCVCKPWYNLTFDSKFIKLHLTRATTSDDDCNLLASEREAVPNMKNKLALHRTIVHSVSVQGNQFEFESHHRVMRPLPKVSMSRLVGSCHGISCLIAPHKVCLFNPCTRECKVVKVEFKEKFSRNDSNSYGFGYDSTKDDYQLVQVVESLGGISEFNIYSLCDASRSTIPNVPYGIRDAEDCEDYFEKQFGTYFNGSIYWVAMNRNHKDAEQVISLEVGANVIREFPIPDSLSKDGSDACLTLGVVEGLLGLFKISSSYVEIWKLKNNDGNATWCQVISTNRSVFDVKSWVVMRPLYFSINGKLLVRVGKDLVMYDTKIWTNKHLNIHDIPDWFEMEKIFTYFPSLVPLKCR